MATKQLTSVPNPPEVPAGKVAKWDDASSKWIIVPIPDPVYVPKRPENIPDGFYTEWDGKQWVIKKYDPEIVPTELQKAEWYLQGTSWLFLDGIIDLLPNAAEVKAARALALEVLKKHKTEIQVASNFE